MQTRSPQAHPFTGGKNKNPTGRHVPLVWEFMPSQVCARNDKGEVQYFAYDWDAARQHANVDAYKDLRIGAAGTTWMPSNNNDILGGVLPKGKVALWGILKKSA